MLQLLAERVLLLPHFTLAIPCDITLISYHTALLPSPPPSLAGLAAEDEAGLLGVHLAQPFVVRTLANHLVLVGQAILAEGIRTHLFGGVGSGGEGA